MWTEEHQEPTSRAAEQGPGANSKILRKPRKSRGNLRSVYKFPGVHGAGYAFYPPEPLYVKETTSRTRRRTRGCKKVPSLLSKETAEQNLRSKRGLLRQICQAITHGDKTRQTPVPGLFKGYGAAYTVSRDAHICLLLFYQCSDVRWAARP